jgi:hypothetical protein
MVSPGVTTRNPRVKLELPERRTAFTVCQVMSIAMTVVFPAPVASLSANRLSSGFASAFALARCTWKLFHAGRLGSDFGEPDGSFDSLDLAEEGPDALKRMVPPVLEKPRRFRGHQPVIGTGQATPLIDLLAQVIDDGDRLITLLWCGKPGGIVKFNDLLNERLFDGGLVY